MPVEDQAEHGCETGIRQQGAWERHIPLTSKPVLSCGIIGLVLPDLRIFKEKPETLI